MPTDARKPRVPVLVGEMHGTELALISLADGTELKANDANTRRDLIARVRSGEHVELRVNARTFRQKDGEPNRNFLRFKSDRLGSIAESFKGMPVLLDHNKWEHGARIGTIEASEAQEDGRGWTVFHQTLKVVKPSAVISVLDGTLDRFSIGWHPTGKVLCSVHGKDVRSWETRCCWPGDKVSVERDGKTETETVEWEFQNADGVEVSAVNVPAVKGTKIEEWRESLALELGLQVPAREERQMLEMKALATVLGLTALATVEDVAAGVRAVEDLRRGRLAAEQERDAARTELATAKESLKTERETMLKAGVDAIIEGAYRDGKLRYGRDDQGKATPSTREARLRRIAKEDGLAVLQAEIADMPQVVPVQQRVLDTHDPLRDRVNGTDAVDEILAAHAAQFGCTPEELIAHRAKLQGRS